MPAPGDKMMLERKLHEYSKGAWGAYLFMKYTEDRKVLKIVWNSLDKEAQDKIRALREA